MAIREREIHYYEYDMVCDRCGAGLHYTDSQRMIITGERNDLARWMKMRDWQVFDGLVLCPTCYEKYIEYDIIMLDYHNQTNPL